jgi:hypothetical protein
LSVAAASDVNDVDPTLDEHASHQEPAMTVGGILFTAQHGDAVRTSASLEAAQSFGKRGRLCNFAVQDMVIAVVESLPVGATTKLGTEKDISHAAAA